MKTSLKIFYLISAAAVGFGCFIAFVFIIFNTGDGFMSTDNEPAAIGVAFLAVVGGTVYLFLGRLIYKSYKYIGTVLLIIIISAFLSLPIMQALPDVLEAYHGYRAKPYVERYLGELKPTLVGKIEPLEFDYDKSMSYTLDDWGDQIWIELKKEKATLSSEDLEKVIGALPPAKYDLRVIINYENLKDPNYQNTLDFMIRSDPTDPPYCDSYDYEHKPCDQVREILDSRD
ncbi:hypothetical protein SAMN05216378_2191 [Paenibacillus catalpae]|uniref:Uncharacterized protein n=1 Tax=Paenibacillus catalpae TaxID=1045775 RepID=A0A1I1XH53_9BACL|nr:hypothetical protein [Paenibacillus catalpae]SFE06622.1 hypothetical protein SAMN05216378_2191 [Paenibacillus catalpae]